MIISRTPYRLSFFGGGTDYPIWYREHGGAVLSAAINRYCYLTCRWQPPFFAHRSRIVYSVIENVSDNASIRHPSVRECLRFFDITDGIEIHHNGDLPKMTGLGTSSSFAVGLLNALHRLLGHPAPTPLKLAQEAIHVERNLCCEHVGSQDQTAAAFGGLNHIRFGTNDSIEVYPLKLPPARLAMFETSMMLFFTGFSRFASEVVTAQLDNLPRKTRELNEMASMVPEGIRILRGTGDLTDFGHLLHESWMLKRSLSSRVSTPEIDAMYAVARNAGALGGKIAGAGGGGFLLLFVPPDRRAWIRKALSNLLYVPFHIDFSGSSILYANPSPVESPA